MKPLEYNLGWVKRVLFHDPTTTEILLAPERDAGNVSSSDYDNALRFAAGAHPFYPLMTACLGVPLALALRKPSWSRLRTFLTASACVVGSAQVGQAMTQLAHVNFVLSLENPSGFAQALENIQKNSGLPIPRSSTIVRMGETVRYERSKSPTETPLTLPSTPDIEKPSINPPSKWDQIRAVNARSSTNSSWDALRQSHERTRVSAVNSNTNSDAFQQLHDEERAVEQAKFDEMLERERNIKYDS